MDGATSAVSAGKVESNSTNPVPGTARWEWRIALGVCALQILLAAYYLVNPGGSCTRCSRLAPSLMIAAAGMVLYSVAVFAVWLDKPAWIGMVGLGAGVTHVLLAGSLFRQQHMCVVCLIALILALALVCCAYRLTVRAGRAAMLLCLPVVTVLAVWQPLGSVDRVVATLLSFRN